MNLVLIKVFISIIVVLTLAYIAERANPKISGLLLGFPMAEALMIFFI